MSTVVEQLHGLWQREIQIEPAPGAATRAHVEEIRTELEQLLGSGYRQPAVIQALEPDERANAETMLAAVLARAATIAFAAGEPQTGTRWLAEAKPLAHDEELRAQIEAADRDPERYRMLVHGRYLIARDHEGRARKLWKKVARRGARDALATSARAELVAPRPVRKMPSLYRVNGIGTSFFGSRDRKADGSYVTTHCFSVFFIPLFPLGAYRVRTAGGGYNVFAREQLGAFARLVRSAILATCVLGVVGYATSSYLNDPDRLAAHHFDDTLASARAAARAGHPEAALKRLDDELASSDRVRVSSEKVEQAGAEVVRITASLVPEPFTRASLDQVGRLVVRYQGLPAEARGGVALDEMLGALDGWTKEAREPETKLALLRHEATVADAGHRATIAQRLAAERKTVAAAKADSDPVGALAVLVEDPADTAAMTEAGKILAKLADHPSLLDDIGADVDTWLAWPDADGQIEQRVTAQREAARAGRAAAEADGVTRAQLEKMQHARPWDQWVGLALAHLDMDAGKLDAADARLRAFGPPALLVREARVALAQIAMSRGKLDVADDLASALLASRLAKFQAASGAFQQALTDANDRATHVFDRDDTIPDELRAKLEAASEDERPAIARKWVSDFIENDPAVIARRKTYLAYADVVPTSILVGTIELRRAQGMSGKARDAMLDKAEKAFLAVKTEAEGQPSFELGLGEIYARLGKTAESDAELGKVLAKHDPGLTLAVASVYRSIGRTERAKQIAMKLYDTASSPMKEQAAQLIGLLNDSNDAEAERWYRRADQKSPSVQAALLQIEGQRLMRQGKYAACERKFAQVAQMNLAAASAANSTGYNNAAVAEEYRFECSGDPRALVDAEAALDKAYRATGDDPIVTGNLATVLTSVASVRAMAKRVDTRALRLGQGEASALVSVLLDSPERDAVLADLTADSGWRRAGELVSQYEVLAPSRTEPYQLAFSRASKLRDEAAAAAVIDQLHRAKALDTSDSDAAHQRWLNGTDDAKQRTTYQATADHYKQVLAGTLSPHTRAVALFLRGSALWQLGTYWSDPDAISQALAAFRGAAKLWPALRRGSLAGVLIDQIAVKLAPARWAKLRRELSPAAALAQLADAGDPLAAKIRAAPEWAEVVAEARAATRRPGVDDLRMAKLTGDPAIEAHAKAAREDKLLRLSLELAVVVTPSDKGAKADLAYLTGE